MMLSVCVVFLVTVWRASAQAPGDEDTRCLNERAQANDVYPPLTKMLMDSRNYEDLISGSRPHWQQLNVDGTGFGVGACDLGNRFIIQYIVRQTSLMVTVLYLLTSASEHSQHCST